MRLLHWRSFWQIVLEACHTRYSSIWQCAEKYIYQLYCSGFFGYLCSSYIWHGMGCYDIIWYDTEVYGRMQPTFSVHSSVIYGIWHGMVCAYMLSLMVIFIWHDMVWCGMMWYDMKVYGRLQPSFSFAWAYYIIVDGHIYDTIWSAMSRYDSVCQSNHILLFLFTEDQFICPVYLFAVFIYAQIYAKICEDNQIFLLLQS